MLTPASKNQREADHRVLLASSSEKGKAQWEKLLGEGGFRDLGFAASGGEARRLLLSGDWDILVVNAPLSDEFGHQLVMDAAEEGCGALLVVKSELWEEVSARVTSSGVLLSLIHI